MTPPHHPLLLAYLGGSSLLLIVLLFSASFLIFLLPTFDAYPWSYHRLLGILLAYVLLYRLARREDAAESPVFARFAALFRPLDASPPSQAPGHILPSDQGHGHVVSRARHKPHAGGHDVAGG